MSEKKPDERGPKGRWIIFYYTVKSKPPEVVEGNFQDLLNRVVEITRTRAKFTIHEVGRCLGDFS